MSGPIVRKYGFPNFDKIFGDKGLQHGTDDEPSPSPENAPKPAGEEPKAEQKKGEKKG